MIHQCGTGLAHPSVDDHRARTTDFLQTIAVPCHRGDGSPISGDRVSLDLLQTGYDIAMRDYGQFKLLPVGFALLIILSFDLKDNGFSGHGSIPSVILSWSWRHERDVNFFIADIGLIVPVLRDGGFQPLLIVLLKPLHV